MGRWFSDSQLLYYRTPTSRTTNNRLRTRGRGVETENLPCYESAGLPKRLILGKFPCKRGKAAKGIRRGTNARIEGVLDCANVPGQEISRLLPDSQRMLPPRDSVAWHSRDSTFGVTAGSAVDPHTQRPVRCIYETRLPPHELGGCCN